MTIVANRDLPVQGIREGDRFTVTGAYCEVYFIRLRSGGVISVPRDAFDQVKEDDAPSEE